MFRMIGKERYPHLKSNGLKIMLIWYCGVRKADRGESNFLSQFWRYGLFLKRADLYGIASSRIDRHERWSLLHMPVTPTARFINNVLVSRKGLFGGQPVRSSAVASNSKSRSSLIEYRPNGP
jgi:hypothetical protein